MATRERSRPGHPHPWLCGLLVLVVACAIGAQPRPRQSPSPTAAVPTALPEGLLKPPSGMPFKVAPIDRTRRGDVRAAAAAIDEILAARQKKDGVEPGRPLDDGQFVRRVYVELGGRIPTCDETLRFFASKSGEKRAELIDSLLESPDYVSRLYCVWAETLRLTELKSFNLAPYLDWVKRSLAENRPFDEWVREMLTADGGIFDSPAAGYQLRDLGMPLPYVDNTVRVFLGTQIGCAQCHDHPQEKWTQKQFYELAALTSGDLNGLGNDRIRKQRVTDLLGQRSSVSGPGAIYWDRFVHTNSSVIGYRPKPLKIPTRSKTSPPQLVEQKVLWGEVPADVSDKDGRTRFAHWLTSRDNRQFARTIANRLWKTLMGVGIVEPIDDFSDAHPASHPELLEHLTDEVLRLDFDLREFIRIVVSTTAWQRQAVPFDPTAGETFAFTAPALRRMTAEQVWDSVVTLVARDIWGYQRPTYEEYAKYRVDIFSDPVDVAAVRKVFDTYRENYEISRQDGPQKNLQPFRWASYSYVRASELPTPVALDHPLRAFGQSERETIDGGRTTATISQVLTLLNGQFPAVALENGTALQAAIVSRPPKDWVDAIFVSVLTRRPDKEERAIAEAEIASGKTPLAGIANVVAALLNTREFLFIQ